MENKIRKMILLSCSIAALLMFFQCKKSSFTYKGFCKAEVVSSTPLYKNVSFNKNSVIVSLKKKSTISILTKSDNKHRIMNNKKVIHAFLYKVFYKENKKMYVGWVERGKVKILNKKFDTTIIPKISKLQSLFLKAIKDGNINEVKRLIYEGVEINGYDFNAVTPVSKAVIYNQESIFKYLMTFSVSQSTKDRALIWAVSRKNLWMITYLLNKGASIQTRDLLYKQTPLITAAHTSYNGYPYMKIMKLLIDKGAKINAVDGSGVSALMYSVIEGREDAIKLLLKHGALKNIKDKKGKSVFAYLKDAPKNKQSSIKKLLSQKK